LGGWEPASKAGKKQKRKITQHNQRVEQKVGEEKVRTKIHERPTISEVIKAKAVVSLFCAVEVA